MQKKQQFLDRDQQKPPPLGWRPGGALLPLAAPVSEGSIHRAKLKAGVSIPAHTHPADEYVLVLSGTIKTGDTTCGPGTFWITPQQVHQGPHLALTDVELLTIRLGPMGSFEHR